MAGIAAELAGDLVAVHAGQHDVEEDEPGSEVAGDLEGLAAVVGDLDVVPGELEQPGHAPGGVDVVVNDEDPRAGRRGGRRCGRAARASVRSTRRPPAAGR